jgi:uncharacterized protein YecT (DUF1311 family)
MLLALMLAISLQPEDAFARIEQILGETGALDEPRPDCGGNTLEMNACLSAMLDRAQRRLDDYQQTAIDRYSADEGNGDAIVLGIQASQSAFEAYRSIECSTVYEDWKDGTIRSAMELGCRIQLTDERTHTIWRNWLRYVDSTPPLRPEPAPTN